MRPTKATRPYHALIRSGAVCDIGSGDYTLQPGQSVLEFDTKKDRALHPLVARWELLKALDTMDSQVAEMKSTDAYAAKYAEAQKFMASRVGNSPASASVYDPDEYPFLHIDVQRTGVTILAAAEAVISAVLRTDPDDMGVLVKEDKRVALRERIKQLRATLTE